MDAHAKRHHKILAALLFVACLFITADTNAYWRWDGGHRGWHDGWRHGWGGGGIYVNPGYHRIYYRNCGWVGGHWEYRRWVPAHRVCWY